MKEQGGSMKSKWFSVRRLSTPEKQLIKKKLTNALISINDSTHCTRNFVIIGYKSSFKKKE